MNGLLFAASFAWFVGTLRYNSDGAKIMSPVAAWAMGLTFISYVDDLVRAVVHSCAYVH